MFETWVTKYLIVLGILLILYGIIYYTQIVKVNNNYEIKQVHLPTNAILETTLAEKLPTVITGSIYNWTDFHDYSPSYLERSYDEQIVFEDSMENKDENGNTIDQFVVIEDFYKKINKLDTINEYTKDLHFPYTYNKKYDLIVGKGDGRINRESLSRCTSFRHLICQLYGTLKVSLFAPNQGGYLYPQIGNSNQSMCDFWNIDEVKYPKFNDAKYIDIMLKQGQILYIPKGWWYCIESGGSVSVISKSKPFFLL